MTVQTEMKVEVSEIRSVAESIKQFTLKRLDNQQMPVFAPGSHIVVSMDDRGRLRRNPYSLMSMSTDRSAYQISVLRVDESRGGSVYMHDHVKVGHTLTISQPLNLFPIYFPGKRHLLVAGGIGITPFISMTEVLNSQGRDFELYYSIRSRPHGAFWSELTERYGNRLKLSISDEGNRVNYRTLLITQPVGTHLYVCGPRAMIDYVRKVTREIGWADENVHYELFLAPPPGNPFTVNLVRSGIAIQVATHQSLLESIEAAGVDAPYLCRGGACGQCETTVVAVDGQIIHNDIFLTDAERATGAKIMPCVSRFVGTELTIDL